jgi:molecular chaperone GrpE
MAKETPIPDSNEAPPEPVEAENPSLREFVSLKEKLAKAEQQKDDMLRTLAEYDNSRKRAARELENDLKFAHSKLAGDLITALDNLDRALAAAKLAGDKGPLFQGVQATQSQVLDVFKRHGITPIESQGQPFDPNKHQAVSMVPSKECPPNTVVQVLQQGFMIHDRVLRPAAVIIAAPE